MSAEGDNKKRKRVESAEGDEIEEGDIINFPIRVNEDEYGTNYTKATVSKPAPTFEDVSVLLPNGEIARTSLAELNKDQYLVIFFYPLDWTFVCPTEITSFSDRLEEFEKLKCGLVGISVDSVYSHLAWTKTPRNKGGLGKLKIPLIGDITKQISQDYGVLMEDGFTMRGLFIIDGKGIIRQITMNDPPVGRNVDEILRLVAAYQHTDTKGEVCPCNWKPGSDTIIPNPEDSLKYFAKVK